MSTSVRKSLLMLLLIAVFATSSVASATWRNRDSAGIFVARYGSQQVDIQYSTSSGQAYNEHSTALREVVANLHNRTGTSAMNWFRIRAYDGNDDFNKHVSCTVTRSARASTGFTTEYYSDTDDTSSLGTNGTGYKALKFNMYHSSYTDYGLHVHTVHCDLPDADVDYSSVFAVESDSSTSDPW